MSADFLGVFMKYGRGFNSEKLANLVFSKRLFYLFLFRFTKTFVLKIDLDIVASTTIKMLQNKLRNKTRNIIKEIRLKYDELLLPKY